MCLNGIPMCIQVGYHCAFNSNVLLQDVDAIFYKTRAIDVARAVPFLR